MAQLLKIKNIYLKSDVYGDKIQVGIHDAAWNLKNRWLIILTYVIQSYCMYCKGKTASKTSVSNKGKAKKSKTQNSSYKI